MVLLEADSGRGDDGGGVGSRRVVVISQESAGQHRKLSRETCRSWGGWGG